MSRPVVLLSPMWLPPVVGAKEHARDFLVHGHVTCPLTGNKTAGRRWRNVDRSI